MSGVDTAIIGLVATLVLMVATWLMSVALRDASLVDRVWGMGFVLVGWVTLQSRGGWAAPGDRLVCWSSG